MGDKKDKRATVKKSYRSSGSTRSSAWKLMKRLNCSHVGSFISGNKRHITRQRFTTARHTIQVVVHNVPVCVWRIILICCFPAQLCNNTSQHWAPYMFTLTSQCRKLFLPGRRFRRHGSGAHRSLTRLYAHCLQLCHGSRTQTCDTQRHTFISFCFMSLQTEHSFGP